MGFVTSFDEMSRPSVLTWLRQLRCTVVQVYDWMESYSYPMPVSGAYEDPLRRPINLEALRGLIEGIKDLGAVAQAYAPVCAADAEFADARPRWRLYRNDGTPQSLGDLLQIMDPGNAGWRRHWIEQYSAAMDLLGFTGLHLDTYGHPRSALDVEGRAVDMGSGYSKFINDVRTARGDDVVSFNQVNGVPRDFGVPPPPSFRYVEVWPPNREWRHLEGLLERSSGTDRRRGDTLALYPPAWTDGRERAVRTAVISEAVATALGANILIWGDADGALRHPYYVDHETLTPEEKSIVLDWHRVALRCRDLFKDGTDTSWYELSDENASVTVSWSGESSPEPCGGALFARVNRNDDLVAVSLLDLSGSHDGSWTSGTGAGACEVADVAILVDAPDQWRAEVSRIGRGGGRFCPLPTASVAMREGRGISCRVPVEGGWAILRLTRI